MVKHLSWVLLVFLLSACVTTSDKQDDKQYFDNLNSQLSAVEQNLVAHISASCKQDQQKLVDDITNAVKANTQSQPTPQAPREKEIVYIERCSNQYSVITDNQATAATATDKMLIGEVENIYFPKEALSFAARIDTGAVTSSIGVYSKTRFERDGKRWIRFTLEDDESAPIYEYPLERTIRIIQQTSIEISRRPVVKMRFKLGDKNHKAEFSLADRAHLDYQVLIGREFLRDVAVVDVSSKFLQGGN